MRLRKRERDVCTKIGVLVARGTRMFHISCLPAGGFTAAWRRLVSSLVLGALAATLSACGGGDSSTLASGDGRLRLALTDAPACGYEEVVVTIERVRVHRDAAADPDDAGWSEVVLSPPREVDLLTLTNGVLEELGQTPLPAGRYTQGRLVLASEVGAAQPPNRLRPVGGVPTPLTTPSAQRSGLKFDLDIDVPAGSVADVVLDFDACRSVVRRGASGQYNLKPVLTALPRLSDVGQRVVGFVDPSIATTETMVSVQSGGRTVKSTPPDPSGRFTLYPVPVGRHDLVLVAPGRVVATITDVPVTAEAPTYVNRASDPLLPGDSPTRLVTGQVGGAGGTPVADVQVLRSYAGGPTVEVARLPADADTGAFAFTLPTGAPLKAAYMPDGVGLAFNPDIGLPVAGYRIVARSGTSEQSLDVDLGAPTLPPLDFLFP